MKNYLYSEQHLEDDIRGQHERRLQEKYEYEYQQRLESERYHQECNEEYELHNHLSNLLKEEKFFEHALTVALSFISDNKQKIKEGVSIKSLFEAKLKTLTSPEIINPVDEETGDLPF